METNITRFLDEHNIPYRLKPHGEPVFTCETAAVARGVRVSQIVKTMVGKDEFGTYHVALIPGDKRLKLKKVRNASGGKRVQLMDRENLEDELGLTVGAIAPLCFPEGTKFYVDPSVLDEEQVDISSGDPSAGLELSSKDLVRIVDAQVCDIVSGTKAL